MSQIGYLGLLDHGTNHHGCCDGHIVGRLESGRLNLGEFLSLGDDLSGVRLHVIDDARELLQVTLAEMETLALETSERTRQTQTATDSFRQARSTLEAEWLQAESQIIDLMNQTVHAMNLFVTHAEFQIGQFEADLQIQIARYKDEENQSG